MAITRSQQAKQMLQDGGMLVKPSTDGKRPGYRNPNEDRAKEEADRKASANRVAAATNVASMQRALGTKDSRTPQQQAARDRLRDQREGTQETLREQRDDAVRGEGPFTLEDEDLTIRERIQRGATKFGPFSFLQKLGTSKLARLNNALQRQNYIDSLDLTNPKDKEEYDRIMNELGGLGMDIIAGPGDLKDTRLTVPPSMLATDPMTQFKTVDGVSALGDPDVKDVLGTGYEEYLDRFNTESTSGDDTPMDPCLGPNPPAYCFVNQDPTTPETSTPTRNLGGLTPRIGGSIFNFDEFAADGGRIGAQEGGIMPRLNQLGSGVSSAEQMLQQINQRLESAESSLGEGGAMQQPVGSGNLFQLADFNPPSTLSSVQTPNSFFDRPLFQLPGNIPGTDAPYSSLRGSLNQFTPPQTPVAMQQPLSGIPAAGYAEGGLADMDREAFLLGGIAKGLKKATRAVKKIAKSPIGKAALLYFGGQALMSGGAGGGLKSFFGKGSFSPFKTFLADGADVGFGPSGLGRLLGKTFVNQSTGALTGLGKIAIPTIASYFMTPKEDKDKFDIDAYYAKNQLNPSQSVRGMGSEFDFYGGQFVADGGRIGYDEAGAVMSKEDMEEMAKSPLYKGFKKMYGVSPDMARDNKEYEGKFKQFEQLFKKGYQEGGDVEPVAKKTLPLIDMDGMEKDYRETGGFVEMGRMEKADDVPARLSKNEFVFTADAVRNAGEGDIDKGAEVMYNMMKNLEAGGEVSEESQGLEGARKMFQTSQRLGEVL